MHKENITRRAFRLYHSFNKKYFPLSFLQIFFNAFAPYFNLWMSAEIVTALYEQRGKHEIFILIVITLLGNLSVHSISSLLRNATDIQLEKLKTNEDLAFNKKTLSLDYDKLENPKIRDLRHAIHNNQRINYYGIEHMRLSIISLMSGGIRFIFSLYFFIEMMKKFLDANINRTGFLLLLLTILCSVLQYAYIHKSSTKHAQNNKKLGDLLLKENKISDYSDISGADGRIYLQSKLMQKKDEEINTEHLNTYSVVNMLNFKISVPDSLLAWLTTLFNYLLVCFYFMSGAFPIGSVIKYTGYLDNFMYDISELLRQIHRFKENLPYLKAYLDYFDIPNDMYQGSLSVEKRSDKKYEIEFKNVSFKYAGSSDYALKNINLSFNVGERLAVVGMNGSGKTTFIKLMCRLYDPTCGEILMNDFNIKKYDYRQYLDLFSVVFQDYSLLALPLGNNVSSAATWDKEKAEKCLHDVGFSERYADMPKGLDTPIYKNFDNDGINISGGEAQKIALARALYKSTPFIILDEPTASLDPIAEAKIYAKFDAITGGKTAIYISHRLSSCRFCDKIAVFDKGMIVQVGTHEELLSDKQGKYYELWTAQAQHYTP